MNISIKSRKKKEGKYGDEHKWIKIRYKILKIYNEQTLLKVKKRGIALINKLLKKSKNYTMQILLLIGVRVL